MQERSTRGGIRRNKMSRREALAAKLAEAPFMTDEALAAHFNVSVQTVRLDRMALRIPELRERVRSMAESGLRAVRSMASAEMVGELLELTLGKRAASLLEIRRDMLFDKSGYARSQFLFAQADCLAAAVVDADVVQASLANVKFIRPARLGERLVARAEVIRKKGNKHVVLVSTTSGEEQVFRGKFVVLAVPPEGEGSL
ncbi:MAG: transcription factor FapR [Bacillota bacterium]